MMSTVTAGRWRNTRMTEEQIETVDLDEPEPPEPEPRPASGPHVEPVGSGGRIYVWECSEGDFVSRINAAEVDAHIAVTHSEAIEKLRDLADGPARKTARKATK